MIYIIADDLTGANDTGVQFAKNGYKTKVSILGNELTNMKFEDNYDVLVIDSETREDEEKIARSRLNKILKSINVSEKDIIYKKIDSTLRGNAGAEIEEVMNIFNKQFCIISPSFPSHQRVTIGGNLFVQNKPLGLSRYSNNSKKKEEESFIPSILEQQTKLSIGRIDLSAVNKGQYEIKKALNDLIEQKKNIIVIDSSDEKNLRDIVSGGIGFSEKVLFSGSAGLANCLAESYKKKKDLKYDIRNNKNPILIVGGSRNPVMVDQIEYLKNKLEFAELKINIKEIYSQESKILDYYVEESLKILKNNQDLAIYTDAINNEKKSIDNELMQEYKLTYKELENKIKEFFGLLTSTIIKKNTIRNMILTGGDIAISVCRELGISNLEVLGELLPGIPLTRAYFHEETLNIITKAGGFGRKKTLYELINKFRNY
ncbi:MAG: four-carbon acid sugar kinase family protein [Atribacterota bacterium]